MWAPSVIRYQPIANSNASDDRVFPTVIGNQKFSLNFYCHYRGPSLFRCATRTTTSPAVSRTTWPS